MDLKCAIKAIYNGYKVSAPDWSGDYLGLNKNEELTMFAQGCQVSLLDNEIHLLVDKKDFILIE